ncbi:hypothetical protein GCM10010423_31990 [Streptomyces levis]|uniref:Uncharacterized protein n=1 Tax=Streptomyces levis TaxID=285566 RepID=A0ABN3NWQ7_9ACTN
MDRGSATRAASCAAEAVDVVELPEEQAETSSAAVARRPAAVLAPLRALRWAPREPDAAGPGDETVRGVRLVSIQRA